MCATSLYTMDDVSTKTVMSLRTAVQQESNCGFQGFVRCYCTGAKRCKTNRCRCFKARLICNSNVIPAILAPKKPREVFDKLLKIHQSDMFMFLYIHCSCKCTPYHPYQDLIEKFFLGEGNFPRNRMFHWIKEQHIHV